METMSPSPLSSSSPSAPVPSRKTAASGRTAWGGLPRLRAGLAVLLGLAAAWIAGRALHARGNADAVYWVGVAGATAMLTLFAYPLRKRWRVLREWGAARAWFVFHMVMGVAGPWLVLVHCGFRAGSVNAAVALASMLVVVASGVIGRYLYVRVHRGLDGRRADLAELRERLQRTHARLANSFSLAPQVQERLLGFEQAALANDGGGPFSVLGRTGRLARAVRPELRTLIDQALDRAPSLDARRRRQARAAWRGLARQHVEHTLAAARWQAWERLFALWHVLHLPFVVVMVVCTLAHVVAVHAY